MRPKSFWAWRLGFAHELGMGTSAFIAVLVVLMGGAFPVVAWGVLLAPLLSSFLVVRKLEAPKFSGTALGLAGLGLGAAQVIRHGTEVLIYGGGIALLGILAGRLITRRTLAHDMQTLILALVLVMAGSVLNPGLSYGVLFGAFGITVIWALTTRQLLSGADQSAAEQGHSGDQAGAAVRERTDIVTPSFFAVTGGVAVAVLIATGVVFFLFPRVGLGNFSMFASPSAGFPSSVNLSGGGINGGGAGVRARVQGVSKGAFLDGLYLRGMVFDALSTRGASRLETLEHEESAWPLLADGKGPLTRYLVTMEPIRKDLVMSLGPTVSAVTVKGGAVNPNRQVLSPEWTTRGELVVDRPIKKAVRYILTGTISKPGYIPPAKVDPATKGTAAQKPAEGPAENPAEDPAPPLESDGATQTRPASAADDVAPAPRGEVERKRAAELAQDYLAVPPGLTEEVLTLARSFGSTSEPIEVVVTRIREFLLTKFEYTLEQPNGFKPDPLIAFLIEDRRGHCEYFASAFALLLRLNGIPARVVGGYAGGEFDAYDNVIVFRERHAHAWVEWMHPPQGWIVDDATPVATEARTYLTGLAASLDRLQRLWGDLIVDYSLGSQLQAAQSVRDSTRGLLERIKSDDVKRVGFAAGALAAGLLLVRAFRRRRRRGESADPLAQAIERYVATSLDRTVPSSWTLREAVAAVGEADPGCELLHEALRTYEQMRFGGPTVDVDPAIVTALKTATQAAKKRRAAGGA